MANCVKIDYTLLRPFLLYVIIYTFGCGQKNLTERNENLRKYLHLEFILYEMSLKKKQLDFLLAPFINSA